MEIGIQNQSASAQQAMGSISGNKSTTGTNKSTISHNRGKKHQEGKGQLEGARNFCSIMVVLWKY